MATTLAQITTEALALPPEEHEQLAASLWDSLPEEGTAVLSEAWEVEIKRRIQAVEDGAETFSVEEVMAELERKYP